MKKFNIFKVLEKDDKELIHSSFLKYLLENYKSFYEILSVTDYSKFDNVKLEQKYRGQRLDIVINSVDEVIVIENKFKSFPNCEQLIKYNNVISIEEYFKNKTIKKYLLCFDDLYISDKCGWIVITYRTFLSHLELFLDKQGSTLPCEEKIFITHYKECLEDYTQKYEYYANNLNELFDTINKDNKFCLKLVYSHITKHLEEQFQKINVKVEFVVCPGNTTNPLIDIYPLHWRSGINYERYIQFQNGKIKFYTRNADKETVKKEIDNAIIKNAFSKFNGKFKKNSQKKENSSFVYKVKLIEELKGKKKRLLLMILLNI